MSHTGSNQLVTGLILRNTTSLKELTLLRLVAFCRLEVVYSECCGTIQLPD